MRRAVGAGDRRAWLVRPRPRARLVIGVLALGLLAGARGIAARPAAPAPWAGPAPDGTWTATGLTLQTNALATDPRHPGVLLAGTEDGVWRSGDGGLRWARAGSGLRGRAIDALAASAVDDTVFAGTADGAVYAHDARPDGPWRRITPPRGVGANPIFGLAVSMGRRGTVLAGTIGALYRGVTDGRAWTWRRVARTGDAAVSSIAWSPSDARSALIGVFGVWPPVLATRDGGRTWRAAATGLPGALPTQALLALPAPRPRVILTTMGGGVWERAADGPWRDISAGLPARHAMPAVAWPGGGTSAVYAGTMGDGVYVKQGDAAWRPLGQGLIGVDNTILALGVGGAPAGASPALLAGTAKGVFRYIMSREGARRSP